MSRSLGCGELIAPGASTGLLMAAYLLMRPYGDPAGGQTLEAAQAFASLWWIASHVFGLLALASFGWLALRVSNWSIRLAISRSP